MQLFDVDPPLKLNVRHSFNSSCSAVPSQTLHVILDVYNTQHCFEKGSWKEKLEDSAAGVDKNFTWRKQMQ